MTDLRLSAAETEWVQAFAERATAQGWAPEVAPDDWYDGMESAAPEGRCLAWTDVIAEQGAVLTIGAYFDGSATIVGTLDNQLFDLQPGGRHLPAHRLTAGSPGEQAVAAADILHAFLQRPIDRWEWSDDAHQYRFADSGVALVETGAYRALAATTPRLVALGVNRTPSPADRPYLAIVWPGRPGAPFRPDDPDRLQLTLWAPTGADAQEQVTARFPGRIWSVWNEEDAASPR